MSDEYEAFANPFLIASIIVIILNLMVFFFFKPQIGRKSYFRSLFYMWIITLTIMYLHHKAVDTKYKKKLEENVNMSLVSKEGMGEDMIEPVIDVMAKDEFV